MVREVDRLEISKRRPDVARCFSARFASALCSLELDVYKFLKHLAPLLEPSPGHRLAGSAQSVAPGGESDAPQQNWTEWQACCFELNMLALESFQQTKSQALSVDREPSKPHASPERFSTRCCKTTL